MIGPERSDRPAGVLRRGLLRGRAVRRHRPDLQGRPGGARRRRRSSATPAATTSPPATSRRPTCSGPAPRASTPRPRSGPWIETELDTEDLPIQGRLNGELRQDGSTSQMIRGVRELVSSSPQAFTLLPGDVIMTGTPAGVGTSRPATATRWRSRASDASPTRWSAASGFSRRLRDSRTVDPSGSNPRGGCLFSQRHFRGRIPGRRRGQRLVMLVPL